MTSLICRSRQFKVELKMPGQGLASFDYLFGVGNSGGVEANGDSHTRRETYLDTYYVFTFSASDILQMEWVVLQTAT